MRWNWFSANRASRGTRSRDGPRIETAPVDAGQDVGLVVNLPDLRPVLDHDLGKVNLLLHEAGATKEPAGLRRSTGVLDSDLQNQIAEPVLFQAVLDGGDHVRRPGVVRDHMALVERIDTGLGRMRLSKNATHELRHGVQIGTGGKRAEQVRKGAIPSLPQSLPGDDRPHAVGGREQVLVLRFSQIVRLRRLDRYLRFVEARLKQNLPDIFRVNSPALPLIGPRALDLNQHDRPNVPIGFGAMHARRRVELVETD